MPEDRGSSRTLSRVEVGGKGQNHHYSPAAAASLPWGSLSCCEVPGEGGGPPTASAPTSWGGGGRRQTLGVWLAGNILLYC